MKPIQSPSELRRGRNILWSQKTLLSKAGKTSPEKKNATTRTITTPTTNNHNNDNNTNTKPSFEEA